MGAILSEQQVYSHCGLSLPSRCFRIENKIYLEIPKLFQNCKNCKKCIGIFLNS